MGSLIALGVRRLHIRNTHNAGCSFFLAAIYCKRSSKNSSWSPHGSCFLECRSLIAHSAFSSLAASSSFNTGVIVGTKWSTSIVLAKNVAFSLGDGVLCSYVPLMNGFYFSLITSVLKISWLSTLPLVHQSGFVRSSSTPTRTVIFHFYDFQGTTILAFVLSYSFLQSTVMATVVNSLITFTNDSRLGSFPKCIRHHPPILSETWSPKEYVFRILRHSITHRALSSFHMFVPVKINPKAPMPWKRLCQIIIDLLMLSVHPTVNQLDQTLSPSFFFKRIQSLLPLLIGTLFRLLKFLLMF